MTRHGAAGNSSRLLVLLGFGFLDTQNLGTTGDNRGQPGTITTGGFVSNFLTEIPKNGVSDVSDMLKTLPLFASSLETGTLQHFWWFLMPFWRGFKIDPRVYWKSIWCFHCFHTFLDTNPQEFNIDFGDSEAERRQTRQRVGCIICRKQMKLVDSNGVARWVLLDGYIDTISYIDTLIHWYMVFHRMSQLETVGVSNSP